MTDREAIVFRTDASVQIGTGHVMRCLTLADALRDQGRECHFICREHPGHLIESIRSRGFPVHVLPVSNETREQDVTLGTAHAMWLGVPWDIDAEQTADVVRRLHPRWVVVDHYALDARWEALVVPQGSRLMVLDDLADRSHQADVLLDQNLGRQADDYADLVPERCRPLIGPRYALLRPEFARLREDSLRRRRSPRLKRLLVSMGGMDKDNVTGKVLDALRAAPLSADLQIDVVMGGNAPWLRQVRDQATAMPWPTRVMADIPDMAQRMVEADLAIGAAGSTSWERCCLGLPAVMVVLAENQRGIAAALAATGACICLDDAGALTELPERWSAWAQPGTLRAMSRASASVTDGEGAARVCQQLNQEA
ncbi:UDP-2,4-diacetamido-2,4,6-trideoxy-beta-L-altropyranose hydrolase [Guyparkeria hydrothermalis]|uniref:UDP-2,4-diacetamido-2,4, 6-trideoxy-beta-L-altropyranose hydrolase n=1 Tax=Guyparkeria TaxID=2035712 RepID=UPI0010ACEE3C|nr:MULTISPECIES: UDP-2,4-diacetamido-2,4,6-trideoxy-beta-L-altropyranose hydrolase [Guyparkeria]MCL7751592.1 UDP-2,4-diacetamido-2,4,6-trideoxy-beta-L-altropyranose hydrolase [Guyparkeria hydrothermalis]TKA90470.1 UDP-2,4-diacetamido-2,4,6-trideoxy-beta-L-altropyranose hydrolase [Guyparkeria sp. SB14A]